MREIVHIQAGQCGNQIGTKTRGSEAIHSSRSEPDSCLPGIRALPHNQGLPRRSVHPSSQQPARRKTKLLFLKRREEDVLWRCELDELAARHERFQVEYVLSDPCESWTGRKGRLDESMLQDVLNRPDGSKCCVCVCGPNAFTELSIGLLKQQGFSEEELHAFQG